MMRIVTLFCLSLLCGCAALPPARMALPTPLQEAGVSLPVEGLGGSAQGRFRVADNAGDFKRSSSRLSFLDMVQRDRATARFELQGPDWATGISADCIMQQANVEVAVIRYPVKRLAYRCQFERGRDSQGSLVLHEAEQGFSAAAPRREGTVRLQDRTLSLRAVYALAGTPLTLPVPAGYVLERDGQAWGAVQLTDSGRPLIVLHQNITPADRRLVIVSALALALLWEQD